MKPVRLAILGLGTVGGGALKLLKENAAEIKRRTGREIQITYVGTRRPRPDLDLGDEVKQVLTYSTLCVSLMSMLWLKSWVASTLHMK